MARKVPVEYEGAVVVAADCSGSFPLPKLRIPVLDQQHGRFGRCHGLLRVAHGLKDEKTLGIRRNIERSSDATPLAIYQPWLRQVEKLNWLAKGSAAVVRHRHRHHGHAVLRQVEDL